MLLLNKVSNSDLALCGQPFLLYLVSVTGV